MDIKNDERGTSDNIVHINFLGRDPLTKMCKTKKIAVDKVIDTLVHITRGRLQVAIILFFLLSFTDSNAQSRAAGLNKITKTFSYKTIGSIHVKADLFSGSGNVKLKPVTIWIHGGGLLFGSRSDLPEEQLNFYLTAGYSVVSIDYRLAPETKLPEIVSDVRDAVKWVHLYGKDSLRIDPDKIFVVGHSGGAYLALVSGYAKGVRPKAIVSFYGYGDIRSEWYTNPDTLHFSKTTISQEAARKLIRDSVITSASVEDRLALYFYSRQTGTWPFLVTNRNPRKEQEWFDTYCPIKNIDSRYPPVLLIHGDKDTDVPYYESTRLKNKLTSKRIDNKLIPMNNYGHLFDVFEGGLSNPRIADVFHEVLLFLRQYE